MVTYVQHAREFGFLWGSRGALPYQAFAAGDRGVLSLYGISGAAWLHAALYLAGIAVSAAFALGWRTRAMAVLFWAFTWSLFIRNPFLLDGGDNLTYLLAFYLIFADCGASLSLDAARRRRRPRSRGAGFAAMVHNYALLAVMLQLCLLYFTSGFFKAQGHVWQDGTAIYYILRSTEFNLSAVGSLFWRNAAVVTLLTWSTVIFELAWPFLIWGRKTRFWVASAAVLLHAAIGYFMGIAWFSMVMISAQAVAFDDSEYRRAAGLARRLLGLGRASAARIAVAGGG